MRAHLADRPIVVIEDSDEDFEVTVWAIRQASVRNPVYRCANAKAIAELLHDRSRWPGVLLKAYPLLVLLDLNLPGTDWRETLTYLRSNVWWQTVPVIVVSTSSQPATVSACYSIGAAGYLQKPLDLDAFAASVRELMTYWLKTVVPPVPPEAGMLLASPARP
jgi:DNA-binding NarL/FixJ family response regulator